MSTGFTSIFKEKDVTFEEFVWRCARGNNSFSHMQGDKNYLDAKLRMPIFPAIRAETKQKAAEELQKYTDMSAEDAAKFCALEYEEEQKKFKEEILKSRLLRRRYNLMLEKINEWDPPTLDHIAFKDFMIDEINNSLQNDCKEDAFLTKLNMGMQNPDTWLQGKITRANHALAYAKGDEEYDMIAHCKNVKWISDLRDSVPITEFIQE